jgi:co-chaperonin GroES (HSP10)|tara:strand:+ start:428 stop:826 length:399 start_codon:yes stop_codon:yes gene_type:complete
MPAHESIDRLPSQKHLIDLSTHSEGDIGLTDDFELNFIFDDILLVEYVDENDEGEIQRNGIFVPTNAVTKAWRKARVILTGPKVEYAKVGDVVIFPNNLGVSISNLDINGKKLKKGIFLNEDRLFGICTLKE